MNDINNLILSNQASIMIALNQFFKHQEKDKDIHDMLERGIDTTQSFVLADLAKAHKIELKEIESWDELEQILSELMK